MAAHEGSAGQGAAPPAGTLLLVDDSALVLAWLALAFQEAGWEVTELDAGADVVPAVQATVFDVVVCDLHMPGISGFEIMAGVAAVAPDVPVIIHSSDGDVSAVLQAVRRGAFDYVIKGDDPGPLLAAAERAAGHARLLRDNRRLAVDLEKRVASLHAAQAELSEAYAVALRANRAKSAFLANMSHELRTPLNAIVGYVDLVREHLEMVGDPTPVEDLKKARKAATHLHSLIGEVLDLSKVEAGKLTLRPEALPIDYVFADVLDLMEPAAVQRSNRLIVRVEPGEHVVWADAQKLRQVLINLVGNASKFTEDGTIVLRAWTEGASVWVAVQDDGIGMSEEQLGRVFEAFEQATADTRHSYGGTGLGLAISRALVRAMGGELEATSEVGRGTTMMFPVPRFVAPS